MADLFGGDIPVPEPPSKKGDTIMSRWTALSHYRKADKGSPKRCKNCQFLIIKQYGNRYFKCGKMGRAACSNSPASDIRVNHVCDFFKKDDGDENRG